MRRAVLQAQLGGERVYTASASVLLSWRLNASGSNASYARRRSVAVCDSVIGSSSPERSSGIGLALRYGGRLQYLRTEVGSTQCFVPAIWSATQRDTFRSIRAIAFGNA